MLSTIRIDVDQDNQPIIVINYQSSEDVRDKLVNRFLETLDGSSLAKISFDDHGPNGSTSSIRPIPLKDYPLALLVQIEVAAVQYQRLEYEKGDKPSIFGEYAVSVYEGITKLTQPQLGTISEPNPLHKS